MKLMERLGSLDRRVIYLIIALGVLGPFLFRMSLPIRVSQEVRNVYDRVESIEDGSYILLACEYDPSTMAELSPMTYAILRHCYRKNLKVIATCLMTNGVNLIERELADVAAEFGKEYGKDYVYLGYKPYPAIVILSMGEDFRDSFPQDFYHTKLDEIPMMKSVRNYGDVDMVLTVNATSGIDSWIIYGHERYRFDLALAVTAVMATDYYPYIQSGQVVGIVGGLVGAAEYESLIKTLDVGTRGANVLSVAHMLIVFFIILANINYFYSKRKQRTGAGS